MKRFRPVLFAALLLAPSLLHAWCNNCNGDCCGCPGEAQCLGSYATCEEACGMVAGGGSGSRSYQEDPSVRAARLEAARRQAIIDTNNYGVQLYKQGNWTEAITWFQSALSQDPGNDLYKQNLANAQIALQNQKNSEEYDRRRAANNAAAIKNMGDIMTNLNFDGGAKGAAGGSSGLDFTGQVKTNGAAANGAPASAGYPPHGDPRIVDARNLPPAVSAGIDKAIKGAYPKAAPEVVDRLKKGFTAVENKDWKVAHAWFQDALKKDPTNAGLQRFVILTEDAADLKRIKAPPAPPEPLVKPVNPPKPPKPPDAEVTQWFKEFREGSKNTGSEKVRQYVLSLPLDDFKYLLALQLPEDRDVEYLFQTNPDAALQLPLDSDVEFLFQDTPAALSAQPTSPKIVPGSKN